MRAIQRAAATAAVLASCTAADAVAQTTIGVEGDRRYRVFSKLADQTVRLLLGQSFVVPTTDTVLQSFTFELFSGGGFRFGIFQLDGRALVEAPLYSQTMAPVDASVPRPVTFTPAGGLPLVGGAMYVALLEPLEPGRGGLRIRYPGTYADGMAIDCVDRPTSNQVTCVGASEIDYAFTAVFVGAPTVTPEPTTFALLGGGLLAVGGAAIVRRRERATRA